MRNQPAIAPRPITTTIYMTSARFAMVSKDLSKDPSDPNHEVFIDLTETTLRDREQLASTICQLHGIGTKTEWNRYRKAIAREHREAYLERQRIREERKAAKKEKAARLHKADHKRKRFGERFAPGAQVTRHPAHMPMA